MVAAPRGETTSFEFSSRPYPLPAVGSGEDYDIDAIAGTDNLRAWLRQKLASIDRPLTRIERKALATLQDIWQSGRVRRTWADLHFPVTARLARGILADCAGDAVIGLFLEGQDGTLELFGRYIALGRERLLFFQARLMKQGSLRATLGAQRSDDATVMLHFASGENNAVESTYFDMPSLLDQSPADALSADVLDSTGEGRPQAPIDYRPGRWRILTTPPLRAPVELAPTDELVPSGWRLEVPDRVLTKLQQLDADERVAVLNLLWGLQRRGGREFLDHRSARADTDPESPYVMTPTPELRVILRPLTESTLTVAEIVYAETLQLFRER